MWWKEITLVFTGWLLSQITQYLVGIRESKQKINKAVYPILNIKLSLEHFISILKSIEEKENLDTEEMDLLKMMWDNDTINEASLVSKLENSVIKVSSLDPLNALQLRLLIDTSKKFVDKTYFFNSLKKDFKKAIAIELKGITLFTKRIDKIIRKLLFRYSKLLYIRYLFYHNRNKKSQDINWSKLFK
ncbi:MAG: hypothetical protein IT276_12850 [Ignavibacteriaceae bacterium]|nr:hypothetical protein [Ignavibacteriaceae bacterium]HRN28026.1 hypothetical protein [Ignavibacteriaceae bacterium]